MDADTKAVREVIRDLAALAVRDTVSSWVVAIMTRGVEALSRIEETMRAVTAESERVQAGATKMLEALTQVSRYQNALSPEDHALVWAAIDPSIDRPVRQELDRLRAFVRGVVTVGDAGLTLDHATVTAMARVALGGG